MTREQNIRAILESNFAVVKDEIIDIAVKNIMSLSQEPTEAINNLINDIEVLRTDPVIIDNDDVQKFAENVLYALNNLIKEGK